MNERAIPAKASREKLIQSGNIKPAIGSLTVPVPQANAQRLLSKVNAILVRRALVNTKTK